MQLKDSNLSLDIKKKFRTLVTKNMAHFGRPLHIYLSIHQEGWSDANKETPS